LVSVGERRASARCGEGGGEEEGEAESNRGSVSSFSSSLSATIDLRARGGRLGLLNTSLGASTRLQLPDTPQMPAAHPGDEDGGKGSRFLPVDPKEGGGERAGGSLGESAWPDGVSGSESSTDTLDASATTSSAGRRARKGRLAMLEVCLRMSSVPLASLNPTPQTLPQTLNRTSQNRVPPTSLLGCL
jgi:hypothetical protein